MLHGFPILYTGTENLALIRSIIDTEHWFTGVYKGRDIARVRQQCIRLTYGKTLSLLSACGSNGTPGAPSIDPEDGSPGAPAMYPVRMMLPVLNKYGSKACFESPGYSELPCRLDPLSVVDEKNIFEMMTEQLNDVFMTNLAVEIDVSRDSAKADNALETALAGKRIVVVGASHGTRIASALEELGIEIIDISVPGWKVTSEAVEAMLSELSSVLAENYSGDTIVIYQLYDNNLPCV
jgi:hypothetical protein